MLKEGSSPVLALFGDSAGVARASPMPVVLVNAEQTPVEGATVPSAGSGLGCGKARLGAPGFGGSELRPFEHPPSGLGALVRCEIMRAR